MSEAPDYKFYAADPLTFEIREELALENPAFTEMLNRAGDFKATAPLMTQTKRRNESHKIFKDSILQDDPKLLLTLNESSGTTATDESNYAHSGTYDNTPTLAQDGGSIVSGEANFYSVGTNGTDESITVPHSGELIPGSDNFTVLWLGKLDGTPASTEYLVSKGAGTTAAYSIGVNSSGQVVVNLDSTSGTSTTLINDSAYHLVVVVFKRGSNAEIWIDGVKEAADVDISSESSTNINDTNSLYVGRNTAGNYLDGWTGCVAYFASSLSENRILTYQNSIEGNKEVVVTYTSIEDKFKRTVLDPGRTALFVDRNGVIVWGGLLWTVKAQSDVGQAGGRVGSRIDLGGSTFWSILNRLLINSTLSYNTDQLTIFENVLYWAFNTKTDASGNLPPITLPSGNTSGVTRERNYKAHEMKVVGEVLEQLSDVNNGFDFYVNCTYDSSSNPTAEIKLYYPEKGRRTDTVLELGRNISQLTWSIDATRQANAAIAIGKGDGESAITSRKNDTSLMGVGSYPLLERKHSYTSVEVQGTLDDHADMDLLKYKYPVKNPKVIVITNPIDDPVGTLTVGDEVRIIADLGYEQVDSWHRITELSIQPPDLNYAEKLVLVFSGQGVSV